MHGLSDEDLAARVLAGDVNLYEVLMRRYNQRLYRIARGIIGDPAEAEDVVQQAYVNAYLHLDQFGKRASFSTWLTKIAVYEALGRLRRRQRFPTVTLELDEGHPMDDSSRLAAPAPDPERQALTAELKVVLESSIDGLPDAYRSVFVMREIEGLSTADTAECLDVSEETVKTRLHRARGMLRDALYERAGIATASVFELHLSRCDAIVAGVFARLTRTS
jgi:RNA polymerase sigma-70 factor (ECF subfamily)